MIVIVDFGIFLIRMNNIRGMLFLDRVKSGKAFVRLKSRGKFKRNNESFQTTHNTLTFLMRGVRGTKSSLKY